MNKTIAELLALPKCIIASKPRTKSHEGHRGLDLSVAADGDDGRFSVFVRVNEALFESFSIGLRYYTQEIGAVVLLRMNGDHGPHRNRDGTSFSQGPHLHGPTLADRDTPPRSGWHASYAVPAPAECRSVDVVDRAISRIHTVSTQLDLLDEPP